MVLLPVTQERDDALVSDVARTARASHHWTGTTYTDRKLDDAGLRIAITASHHWTARALSNASWN